MNYEDIKDELLVNKRITPDGTVLESVHRHHYVEHEDANGELYVLDGGLDYVRRSVNKEEGELLGLTLESPLETLREHFTWTSYGINGDEPAKRTLLRDISDNHLINIINHLYDWDRVRHLKGSATVYMMYKELAYRYKHNLNVKE